MPAVIDIAQARETICACHYTRSWPAGKSKVFSYDAALVVFSIPANYNVAKWLLCPPNRVWELTRLWAPDGHAPNLLTQAIAHAVKAFRQLDLADALISYADPNARHKGGVYRAASWTYLGQSEEARAYRKDGLIVSRRKFHSGKRHLNKNEIMSLGYAEHRLPGKYRFARGLTRRGKKAVAAKVRQLANTAS